MTLHPFRSRFSQWRAFLIVAALISTGQRQLQCFRSEPSEFKPEIVYASSSKRTRITAETLARIGTTYFKVLSTARNSSLVGRLR